LKMPVCGEPEEKLCNFTVALVCIWTSSKEG